VQMLAPVLASVGAWQQDNYICVTTWPGYTQQPPQENTILTYPGDGAGGVYYSEEASESPFVPGDFVGLPQGTTTGPHLLVYVWGAWARASSGVRVVSASLAGPDGKPLDVRSIDHDTDTVGPYLPWASAILIPVQPLQPSTTYKASVTMGYGGQAVSHDWTFTTESALTTHLRVQATRKAATSGCDQMTSTSP